MVGVDSLFDEPFQSTASDQNVRNEDEQNGAAPDNCAVKSGSPAGIGRHGESAINKESQSYGNAEPGEENDDKSH